MLIFLKRYLPYRLKIILVRKFPEITQRIVNLLGNRIDVESGFDLIGTKYFESLLLHTSKIDSNQSDKPKRLIAIFSPSIETNSGIAWYTKNLIQNSSNDLYFHWYSTSILSHQEKVPLDLISGKNYLLIPIENFEKLHLETYKYQDLVYMLGNGKTHNLTFQLSRTYEGTVVVHDLSVPSVELMLDSKVTFKDEFTTWKFPRKAKKYIFHSKYSLDYFLERNKIECNEFKIFSLPAPNDCFELIRNSDPDLYATFGFIGYDKEPFRVLETFFSLSQLYPEKKFAFVGPIDLDLRKKLMNRWLSYGGVEKRLLITGAVTREGWLDFLGRTFLAVQLRSQTNGESSATVSEMIAARIPCVVTNIGTFSEIESDLILKVEKGVKSVDLSMKIISWSKIVSLGASSSSIISKHSTYQDLSQEIFSIG